MIFQVLSFVLLLTWFCMASNSCSPMLLNFTYPALHVIAARCWLSLPLMFYGALSTVDIVLKLPSGSVKWIII